MSEKKFECELLRVLVDTKLKEPKAAFARRVGLPGGGSMFNQHLSGHRPIAIEAAIAYAKGFDVKIDDVSPDAAGLIRDAVSYLSDSVAPVQQPADVVAAFLDALAKTPKDRRPEIADVLKIATIAPNSQELRDELKRLLAPPA